ncbi:MAG TPA: methyltransferase domain-containing protein [Cyclobacteriaceae bacterium]|nr:methyltransferase domain-containing protein [Cyclobacteriaceae bacterium]
MLHRSTSTAVIEALNEIFSGDRYADKVIEKVLKQNPKWGSRDRRFIAETTYNIVRWYRLLQELSGTTGRADHWKLFAAWMHLQGHELPHWAEFAGLKFDHWNDRLRDAQSVRKIRESIPDWLDNLGEKELGPSWEKELHALNEEARVVLRANALRIRRHDLQKVLKDEGVETEQLSISPDAIALRQRQNVFQLGSFKEGLFELQDGGSQLIAPFLNVEPGMRVVDACAGAGGKTLHLAALMQNKGRILAMDSEAWKLEELKKRARRSGAANIETRVIDSSKVIKRLEGSADRLLLDVPCSGLGVLKRNPDAKWKLSEEFVERVKGIQQNILRDYSKIVKPGGKMVYSTCSLLPSENEEQVKAFLENNPEFTIEAEKKISPSEGFDGFYMARLNRI